ncbi:MAG: hypothetical protein NW201_03400, partial [Gemmatimonadales bacterium]|nr:hypothetical protein [Gemmatimonadales bacterium]
MRLAPALTVRGGDVGAGLAGTLLVHVGLVAALLVARAAPAPGAPVYSVELVAAPAPAPVGPLDAAPAAAPEPTPAPPA